MAHFVTTESADGLRTMHINLDNIKELKRLEFPSGDSTKPNTFMYFLDGQQISALEYGCIRGAINQILKKGD
ncbi:MAG: hypothetical protein IJQ06_00745 [Paludibacteraceae bacterium]|nr:hypothetical protein [Paludibacteraceae bacterium]